MHLVNLLEFHKHYTLALGKLSNQVCDAMEIVHGNFDTWHAIECGQPYQTLLDLPPADPRVAHHG